MAREKTEEELEAYKEYQKYIKSQEFQDIKQLVLQRDNYHCMCCGRTEADMNSKGKHYILQAHHNTYKHLYHEREHLDDLITLCNLCHASIHQCTANMQRFKKTTQIENKELF